MAIKLELSCDELLNKVFAGSAHGYDPLAVDEYLDRIIKDYKLVADNVLLTKKEYETLNSKIKSLNETNKQLEIELERYKRKFANIKESDNVTKDNIDLVKRINVLETFLWAHGFNPDAIKK